MPIYACVLAEVEVGHTLAVVDFLKQHLAVGMVTATAGPYDLLMIIRADTPDVLGKIIVTELQAIEGIESTLTLFMLQDLQTVNWMTAQLLEAHTPPNV